ncbi:MAG: DmsC/YnfH family molybdoenzyme membrane anchor subunit [Pseudomonadota bacterium]
MHPAPSLIVFTTLSGAGFGLMIWLGLAPMDGEIWVAAVFSLIALGLASGGLLASLAHLGRPERAWKALSQWRSSWLSREGILAILTVGLFSLYAGLWVASGRPAPIVGGLASAAAFATVVSTAMIYASLKSIPRWHSPWTPAVFVTSALAGGALLSGQVLAALFLTAGLALIQVAAWRWGDGAFARAGSSRSTATGLAGRGEVRQLEPPHTGSNYLLREMVHVVGRRHSRRLRVIALVLVAGLPLTFGLLFTVGHGLGALLVVSHLTGVVILRWLFFAEAEHVVGLYYGAR